MFSPKPADSQNTAEIIDLVSEVYAEYHCVLDVETDEPYLLNAGEYFRSHGGEFWVIEDNGKIKATVAVKVLDDESELKTLYVHSSLRQRGLGRKLIALATDFARNAKSPKMFLWSDTRFADAHRLYEKMGFTLCGERECADVNNSIEYKFEKLLV